MTAPRTPSTDAFLAADLLHQGRTHERGGRVDDAMRAYARAADEAGRTGQWAAQAQALRRQAVLHHRRGESEAAATCCDLSLRLALSHGDEALAAETLNVQGGIANERGDLETARACFEHALSMHGVASDLTARIAQNLGINANIRGNLDEAMAHYAQSLAAWDQAGSSQGRAIAYHNLGKISADRQQWPEADRYFEQSRAVAEQVGDVQLQALCLLNHSEVHVGRQKFDEALDSAERALVVFDQLGDLIGKTEAYTVIGGVYRDTGRLPLAESRLTAAVDLARSSGSLPCEAEASRELALTYQSMGRNQEALRLLNAAHGLFRRIDAALELMDVGRKVAQLEATFLDVVRSWGMSIESSDRYTFGHCERVASYAESVARQLGLSDDEITTVRLGAYLHDVGKIKVPHEVLNKPGRLTPEEAQVIQMHPVWGVELLADVEFPWDIKPIIRWHHEKYDGTGYPDRLRGDEIPRSAMIIGIVDVYDALTTTRSYRPAMSRQAALAEMQHCRGWWRDDVYQAFERMMAETREAVAA